MLNVFQISYLTRAGDRLIVSVWVGTVTLAIALLATALILPLSPLVGAGVAGSFCLIALLSKRTRTELVALRPKVSRKKIFGFLALAIAIASLMTRQVTWYDTGYYHYQVIQWLEKFGTVPGVALLFPNFGFTSSWFAFAAPLNAEIFDARVSAVTNGFVFLIATLQFFICLTHCLKRKAYLSDWFMVTCSLILLPALMLVSSLATILVSPSPDIPVIFLVEVTVWSILGLSTCKEPSPASSERAIEPEVIPLFLAAGAVTVKLTALPVLLISSLFFIFIRGFKARRFLIAGVVITVAIAPMLISGAITSGCPIYPSSLFCLDLPWSPALEEIKQTANGTHGVITWADSPPSGIHPWLWSLWRWFNSSIQRQFMAFLVLFSIFPAIYLARKVKMDRFSEPLWVILIAVLGIVFIILQSPFFRFAIPYLVLLPALGMAIYFQNNFVAAFNRVVERLSSQFPLRNLYRFMPIICLSLIAAIITSYASIDSSQLLLPPQIQRISFEKKQVNDITYFSPIQSILCWATQLPCTVEISPNVKLRNSAEGIAGGFVRIRN
ncbi:hypothetical protein H6F76_12895 [Leptolyngbya sp. FACHB-321]|uniref:LIC_10190 family membrane protein n=1 Tax=Leptolyngbya sp. FACHB-321 TaxID=2692807 RepID=UPI001683B7F9|nr:hypothetical protein [Leptolyngbya sp. FACHB-321]MBD2035915.1 hypothetical protein [Leptolyngbya sp. FACHB-321]